MWIPTKPRIITEFQEGTKEAQKTSLREERFILCINCISMSSSQFSHRFKMHTLLDFSLYWCAKYKSCKAVKRIIRIKRTLHRCIFNSLTYLLNSWKQKLKDPWCHPTIYTMSSGASLYVSKHCVSFSTSSLLVKQKIKR